MVITWYGQLCVKLQSKDTALVFYPYGPSSGLKMPKVKADIVCASKDAEHAQVDAIGGTPFVITTPGEYEKNGVFIHALPMNGGEPGKAVTSQIFIVESEGIHITHLGKLHETTFSQEQLEAIEETDVLILPVGGGDVIAAKQAVEMIKDIEPRIIIPVMYKIPKVKARLEPIEGFLKLIGAKNAEAQKSLKLTKKDLPQEDMQTFVVEPQL